MKFVLDTTAFSHLMRHDPAIEKRIQRHPPTDIATVPPVMAEIHYGSERIELLNVA
jgi:predicted nucleic acid-binding protein